MGMAVRAFIESQTPGSQPEAQHHEVLAQLYLDRSGGLQLHALSGSTGDPPYQVQGLSWLVRQELDGDSERMSDPYEIKSNDPEIDARRGKLKGPITKGVEAALSALRAIGADGRIIFWFTG